MILASMLMFLSGCAARGDSGSYAAACRLMKKKDYTGALSGFQEALKNDGRDAECYRMEGIIYLDMNDCTHAVTLLKKSLQAAGAKNEKFAVDVRCYLAKAYLGLGKAEEATKVYDALIKDYDSAKAYFLRASYELDSAQDEKAAKDFKGSLKADGSAQNYIDVYLAYAGRNRSADGAKFLSAAVKEEPKDTDESYQQGRIYYYLEDYKKAEKVLKKAVDGGSTNAAALLGRTYLENKDIKAARALYNKCKKTEQSCACACNGLALCDIAEGNYDDALSDIEKGLKKKDGNERENLMFNRIVAYEKKQDFASAKNRMADFLKEYPDNAEAVRENTFLQSR